MSHLLLSVLLLLIVSLTITASILEESNQEKSVVSSLSSSSSSSLRRRKGSAEKRSVTVNSNSNFNFNLEEEHDALLKDLIERMKPHSFQIQMTTDADRDHGHGHVHAPPKQFYHLHHMKTGGTSLSHFISCGTRRYEKIYERMHNQSQNDNDDTDGDGDGEEKLHINAYRLSECSKTSYNRCISDPEYSCRDSIAAATVMTYCAPLAITDYFQWGGSGDDDNHSGSGSGSGITSSEGRIPSVTMLRDPVERVWSMYRFQTKRCYQCKSLLEVYDDIDSGNVDNYDDESICIPQLTNHLTRNLLTNLTLDELNNYTYTSQIMTDEQKLNDAIQSLRNRFTVVGIIERLQESIELFSYSFPWLSVDIRDSDYFQSFSYDDRGNNGDGDGDGDNYLDNMDEKDLICKFPHANSSPANNRCGANGHHLDMPDHPDEEMRRAIEKHNLLDMKLYAEALDHFELQKLAMNWEEEEGFE